MTVAANMTRVTLSERSRSFRSRSSASALACSGEVLAAAAAAAAARAVAESALWALRAAASCSSSRRRCCGGMYVQACARSVRSNALVSPHSASYTCSGVFPAALMPPMLAISVVVVECRKAKEAS